MADKKNSEQTTATEQLKAALEENNALKSELAIAEKTIEELTAENNELNKKINSLIESNKLQGVLPMVEHNGDKYQITGGACFIEGFGKVSADDIANKPELVKVLVEMGSGFIKKI